MKKRNVLPIPLVTFNTVGITGNYQPFNVGGFPHACFAIKILNESYDMVFFSYDGVTDHEYLKAGDYLEFGFNENSQPNNWIANFRKGGIVYIKSKQNQGGFLYLSGWYQPGM